MTSQGTYIIVLSCVTGLDKLNMPASDAHLPRIPKQQQQERSKESQAASHIKKDSTSKSSVLNQTVFTDAREAAMLSKASNTTTNKTNTNTVTSSSNITKNTNITNSTQQLADTPTEDGTSKHVSSKDGEEKMEAEMPVKKPLGKKPRIIFHPEDECRRSSKPSNDDDDILDSDSGSVDNNVSDVKESEETVSSSEEEETASSNKEVETDKFSIEEEAASISTPSKSDNLPSTSKQSSGSNAGDSQSQHADTYQNSEFRPYNPLSHVVEEKLFPRPFGPANFFDYPSWPDKTECLDVVENLSSWVKSSRMDIDMAKRGHK